MNEWHADRLGVMEGAGVKGQSHGSHRNQEVSFVCIPRRQERGHSCSGSRLPANSSFATNRDFLMCLGVKRIKLFLP